jgi:hypothetical protein
LPQLPPELACWHWRSQPGQRLFTPLPTLRIAPNHKIPLDLNHDGIRDFSIVDTYERWNGNSGGGYLGVSAAQGNAIAATQKLDFYANDLAAGVRIGPRLLFGAGKHVMATEFPRNSGTGINSNGPWRQAEKRYLGLEFAIDGKTHFGWARLSVKSKASGMFATLTGYAYETIPNKSIIAGKTKGPDAVTVAPATLGHLASGAAAIPAVRMKQISATTH